MVTMQDIASRVGVSKSTVSHIMNNRETALRISVSTRERVMQAAAELGYRPNALAHAVATGKNRMIGFLVYKPEYEPVARMLSGALDEAEDQGYSIKVMRLRNNTLDHKTIEQCADLRLAGVIVMYLDASNLDFLHEEMKRYRIPVSVLDSSVPLDWGIRVISDDEQGCRLAVQHLAGLGHKRIAFVSGDPGEGIAILREKGYRDAMAAARLPVPPFYFTRGNWIVSDMEAATRDLLAATPPPTAILCASDETAMVVTRTLRRSGLNVPQDMSVVGFSDLMSSQYFDPPLTTVAPPFYAMGQAIARALLNRVRSTIEEAPAFDDHAVEELLPNSLTVRESTAAPARD